jgi:hypothetical protein
MAKLHSEFSTDYTDPDDAFAQFDDMWTATPGVTGTDAKNCKIRARDGQSFDIPDRAMASYGAFRRWYRSIGLDEDKEWRIYTEDFSGGVHVTEAPVEYDNEPEPPPEEVSAEAPDEDAQTEIGYDDEEEEEEAEAPEPEPIRIPGSRKPIRFGRAKPLPRIRRNAEPEPERATKDKNGRWRYRGRFVSAAKARGINAAATRKGKR